MLQVGRSIVGSCSRKVGICVVVGMWESIKMELSRGSLLL